MIKFKIVTPERILLETEVDSVTLPTRMGEITVLKDHVPMVSSLSAGEVKYKIAGSESFFAVSGGFIEVRKNHEVVVLADTAEFGHEIDEKRAEEAREKARELMRGSLITTRNPMPMPRLSLRKTSPASRSPANIAPIGQGLTQIEIRSKIS
jgi:F-type H+-transporting ATPase subunit epsilon